MKTVPVPSEKKRGKPFYVHREGSISVPIYRHTNIIPQRDEAGKIIYGAPGPDGERKAEVKYTSDIYTVVYYEGAKRVRLKFAKLDDAKTKAAEVGTALAKGQGAVLRLRAEDALDYVRSLELLRTVRPEANLYQFMLEIVPHLKRLPPTTPISAPFDDYARRNPAGFPAKTVREVVDELVESKRKAGKSYVYIKDLETRLGRFADSFVGHRLSTITGKQIEDFVRMPKTIKAKGGKTTTRLLTNRTQNNIRQRIGTLLEFAKKRGYLPKDHDEIHAVEVATEDPGEIEVFTPAELRRLFAACKTPVQERGKWRTREEMIPYLAIAAFCGLRAAEIQRLDWGEIHLTGPERFIEVKANKAKTASRRTVPIPENCALWLAPFAKAAGPMVSLARTDKQLFIYLAEKSGVPWKRNGLRHSFISYRLAVIKDVGQVSLEAGNSPQMVFKHYRQLVRESEAADWFSISPAPDGDAKITPIASGDPAAVIPPAAPLTPVSAVM